MNGRPAFVALLLGVARTGCASVSGPRDSKNNDPLEPINRVVFNANEAIDTAIIKPLAEGYRAVVPQFFRDRIRAFIDNLQEPRIFVNNLLQLRINDAGFTFSRFYVNSILGLGGMFDIALDQIKANALDYYAQFRSIARQYREGQLRAARGLAEEPQELVDPGAPAQ